MLDFENGLSDIIGLIGVAFILVTYAALQLEKLNPKALPYSVLNAIGSALIVLSLLKDFNLAAFAIEASWFLISLFGIGYIILKRVRAGAVQTVQYPKQPQDQ
ncbi:MAG: hypothetical protein PVF65_06590 [Sphingomonadales bacterium]